MFCPNCGATVPEGSKFCAGCGQPMQASAPSAGGVEVRYSKPKAKPAEPVYTPPVQAEPVYTPPVQAEPVYTPPVKEEPVYAPPKPAAPVYTPPQPAKPAAPAYTPPAPPAPAKPKKAKKKSKLPLIIVALVVIVAIVVGAIALLGGGSKESVCVAYDSSYTGDGYTSDYGYEYEFDDDGNLVSYTYTYDYSYEDYDGYNYSAESEVEIEYDDKGNIETVTVDSNGVEYEFEYVYEGKELVEAVCEEGDVTITATFEDGKIVSVERDDGEDSIEIASYEYDGDVLVEEIHKDSYYKHVYTYDEEGNLTETKDYYDGELNYSCTYEYDEQGNIVEQVSTNIYDGEKHTTTTTYEYTYGKGDRVEGYTMTVKNSEETLEIECVIEWESDTERTITYEGDDAEEYYGEDAYAEQELDKDGNIISAVQYQDGDKVNETTRTYEKLTKKQQEQMDQIAWIIGLFT